VAKGKGLLGSGSSGRTANKKFGTGAPSIPVPGQSVDPSQRQNPDVNARNLAEAQKGVMLSKQLRKNKSTGLKP
jgi:hypothetical protein